MSNGDADGHRARKQLLVTRQAAISTLISAYTGDSNGRLDLVLHQQFAKDEAGRIATST